MDTTQMENILYNLNNLEISFKEFSPTMNYNSRETYERFLNHFFIQKNRLERVYWPNRPNIPQPHLISSYSEINGEWLFTSSSTAMMKQINLPFEHMLSNTFFQCVYIMEGSAVLKLENQELHLKKGDFFILFPDINHLLNTEDNTIAINILIQKEHLYSDRFHILERNRLFQKYAREKYCVPDEMTYILFHTTENKEVRTVVLQMFVEYLHELPYKEEVMDSHLTLLFAYLMRYQIDEIEFSVPLSSSQRIFEKVCQYCQNNLKHATLSSAAGNLNYSRQYICRVVKEITGDTFNSMLIKMKIDMSKQYLSGSNLTLNSIAELTGFTDASHFSRTFKTVEGQSPSAYRSSQNQ